MKKLFLGIVFFSFISGITSCMNSGPGYDRSFYKERLRELASAHIGYPLKEWDVVPEAPHDHRVIKMILSRKESDSLIRPWTLILKINLKGDPDNSFILRQELRRDVVIKFDVNK